MFLASTLMFFSPLIDCQWLRFIQDHLSHSWSQTVPQCCISTTVLAVALREGCSFRKTVYFTVFMLWTRHTMTLQPVFVAKPTINSFIYPRANGNIPGREAAFRLVCTSCWNFFGWHPLYVSLPLLLYIILAHAIGCSRCSLPWLPDLRMALLPLCSGIMFCYL